MTFLPSPNVSKDSVLEGTDQPGVTPENEAG